MEVCPEAGVIIQNLACRIEKGGGAALVADYCHDGTKTDTFRVSNLPSNKPQSSVIFYLSLGSLSSCKRKVFDGHEQKLSLI